MLTEHPLTVGHALFRASISHTTNYVTLLGTGKVAPGSRCPLLPSLPHLPFFLAISTGPSSSEVPPQLLWIK